LNLRRRKAVRPVTNFLRTSQGTDSRKLDTRRTQRPPRRAKPRCNSRSMHEGHRTADTTVHIHCERLCRRREW
jgi:hypothetical protein